MVNATTLILAGSLQIFFAENNALPWGVEVYCGECHDGSIATLPRVSPASTHPTKKSGMTCISCHESNDPKPTPWKCCRCHADVCYGGPTAKSSPRRSK
jgi:hypothetical protein